MKLNEAYQREDFIEFLKEDFLSGFQKDVRDIDLHSNVKTIQKAKYLGQSEDLEVQIFELEVRGKSEKKISQALDSFKLLREYQSYRALIAYYSEDDTNWRLALLQMTPDVNEKGRIANKFSNPRRYSFLLGPQAKVKTPEKYLIKDGAVKDFEDLQRRFSVEVVNKDFYREIAKYFSRLTGGTVKFGQRTEKFNSELELPYVDKKDKQKYQEFAVRLIGRIIFCWFLKQKKSNDGVSLLPDEYLSFQSVQDNQDYYHSILEKVFFEVLNKPVNTRKNDLVKSFEQIPFLNGGLFDPHPDDYYEGQANYGLKVPDKWFNEFFEVLETYNFTIDENTVLDTDLSIDPEMLGRIFENLLAEINPETGESARKATGSYYTPRQIVEYMVDQSISQYLINHTGIDKKKISALVSVDELDDERNPLSEEENGQIVGALDEVSIIDPACGSGAFPIGVLQKIVWILSKVDPSGKLWFDKKTENLDHILKEKLAKEFSIQNFDYIRKIGVIKDSIFGVDILPIAVEVSKLRCFLTLVVDESIDDGRENRGIEPLPNLEFKFVSANTLMKLPGSLSANNRQVTMFEEDDEIEQLRRIRDRYFTSNGAEKDKIKIDFYRVQKIMFDKQISGGRSGLGQLTMALARWDPFKDDPSNWFDPEWMFGIRDFDIVIANPPYISYGLRGTQKISAEDKKLICETFPNSAEYKISIYALFMDKAIELAKESGGIQTYIVPDSFLLGRYFSKIRSLILKRCEIDQISWLPYKIFEATVGYSVIYTFSRKSIRPDHLISARYIKSNDEVQNKSYQHFEYSQSYFNTQRYNRFRLFFDKDTMKIVSSIEQNSKALGLIIKFSSGLIALNGQSSIVSKIKDNDKWLKGITSGSEIRDYAVIPQGNYLLYDKSNIKSGYDCVDYFKEKIFMRQTGDKLICAFDGEGLLALNNVHIGNLIDSNYSLKFMVALLNSNLMNFYYKTISLESGRTMAQTDIETVEGLPIQEISSNEQKPFIELVDNILDITKNGDFLSDNEKRDEVKEYQKKIDQLVYSLYKLTPDETKIIEEGI